MRTLGVNAFQLYIGSFALPDGGVEGEGFRLRDKVIMRSGAPFLPPAGTIREAERSGSGWF